MINAIAALTGQSRGFPFDALAYYKYIAGTEAGAILERVNKQTSTLTERFSNVNALQQDGSVITFLPGFAALTGSGDLIQGAATNLIAESNDISQWDMTNVTDSVSGQSPSPLFNYTKITMNAGTSNNFILYNSTIVIAEQYTQLFAVKKQLDGFIQVAASGGFATSQFTNVNLFDGSVGNSQGVPATVLDGGDCWYITMSAVATSSSSFGRMLCSFLLTDINLRVPSQTYTGTENYEIWHGQLETGSVGSSLIFTSGAPATRIADNSTISTVLEFGLLLDKDGNGGIPMVAGQFNTGSGWTGGVEASQLALTFAGNDGGTPGKYSGLIQVAGNLWDGITLTGSNGIVLTGIRRNDAGLDCTVVNNPTVLSDADAFQQGFENLGDNTNLFKFDFSTCGYFTDQAALLATRISAGDTLLGGLPAVEVWPTTNFRLTFEFEFRGIDGLFSRIFESAIDADDRNMFRAANTQMQWLSAVSGVDQTVNTNVDPATFNFGDIITGVLEVSSTTGSTLTVNEVSGSSGSMTSVAWPTATITLLRGITSGDGFNGVVPTILLEPLS